MRNGPFSAKKRGPFRRDSFFNEDTWAKNERGYCIWACVGQKPPSVSQTSSPSGRGSSYKIGTETENGKSGKIGLEDAFDSLCSWFCWKNWERFLFPILCWQKTSFGFLKFVPVCSESLPEEGMVTIGKNGKSLWKWFFGGKKFRTPPPSLNPECPGGSGIEPGPYILEIKSGAFELTWVLKLIPDPPLR